jgi:hypothetical protein
MTPALVKQRPILAVVAGVLSLSALPPTLVLAQVQAAPQALVGIADVSRNETSDVTDKTSTLTVVADFNRDGIADIAKVTVPTGDSPERGMLTISLFNADGTVQRTLSRGMLGHKPRAMAVVDVNRDGIPDLIVGDEEGALMLFLGDGTGALFASGSVAHLDSVVSIAVGDFNHDGIPDIAVSDWRSGSVRLLIGERDGSFSRGWSFPVRMAGTAPSLVAADFNNDGVPDLAVVYGNDDAYTYDVMLGDGNGYFSHSTGLSFIQDPDTHCNT